MSKEILLKDFHPRTALVTEDNTPDRARFPFVDAHNHLGKWDAEEVQGVKTTDGWTIADVDKTVALMDAMNVRTVVNLDGGWGDQLKMNIDRYKVPYPERFCVFAWVNWEAIDDPDFGEKWALELERSVAAGAQGLKVFKTLGLSFRDNKGKLIKIDDRRLDPVWEKAGQLDIPVLIHSADPVAFFWPLDNTNERWDELHAHPDWHFYGKDYPDFQTLIDAQLKVVSRHPNTKFISAHILSYAENLKFVRTALDTYPNLYVDIGERIGELGRQPYSARSFLIDYADRVLAGTDIPCSRSTYQIYFRCLETADEYFDYGRNQGRYAIYGLYLPDEVLKKIYYKNACRVIPGLDIAD